MAGDRTSSAAMLPPAERSRWRIRWDRAREAAPAPPDLRPWPAGSLARLDGGGWAMLEGHLLDRAALAEALAMPGDSGEGALVGAALRRWGAAALERLHGSFFLAAWLPETGTLHVARDGIGLHPVYFREAGDLFWAASAVEPLLAEPEISRAVRPEAVAELLLLEFSPAHLEESFFRDLARLPGAHRLEVTREELRRVRWWEPLPDGFAWASEDEVAGFEERLTRSVARVLEAGADSIALSGGYDSVGLAALAMRKLGHEPPLHAASLRFPGESFDEATTQVAVARTLGMPQTMLTLGEGIDDSNLVRAALDAEYLSPQPVLGYWNRLYSVLFDRAEAAGCHKMIFGTGGDEMLVVDLSHAHDCLRTGRLVSLWRYLRAVQRTSPFGGWWVTREVLWRSALRPWLRGAAGRALGAVSPRALAALRRRRFRRRLPPWITEAGGGLVDRLEARRGEAPPLPRQPEAIYARRMQNLLRSPLLHLELEQAHAWSRHYGLTGMYPFFDRDLVGLSLRIHPRDLIALGRFKSPLRQVVARWLPDVAMPRRKVDFTDLMHKTLRRDGPAVLEELGGLDRIGTIGAGSPLHLRQMLGRYWGRHQGDALRPWLILSTESWLRKLER